MVTLGLPGCWAERYGSRAPEWRSKVSTNKQKGTYFYVPFLLL